MKLRHFWHRSSIAVFTLTFSLLLSVGLASALFSGGISITLPAEDTPAEEGGDGYQADEDCGYLQGQSSLYYKNRVEASSIDNNDQICLDAFAGASTGLFNQTLTRESHLNVLNKDGSIALVIDMAPSSVATENRAQVDLSSGKWSGYGKIISPSVPKGEEWVWFDWRCKNTATCNSGMAGNEDAYWVTSNTTTGATVGFAWSDYLANTRGNGNGFIKFDTMLLETPPKVIVPYVEVEANRSDVTPSIAKRETAPQANGVDFWRVGIYFVDMVTGDTLDETDLNYLAITPKTDDSVFVNQVKNKLDAVDISTWHPAECSSGTDPYCVMIKDDGTVTFNTFIRSYAPTSNMVWMKEDVNSIEQDLPTDRDGCVWTYLDQINNAGVSSPVQCATDTSFVTFNSVDPDVKWDYFYARSDERNYINLNSVTFQISFEESGQGGYSLLATDNFQEVDNGAWSYTPSHTELSFSPRFALDGLYADYDGYAQWTSISENIRQENMYLITEGHDLGVSEELKNYLGGSLNESFKLFYQLDAGTDFERDQVNGDVYLVMDTVDGNISNVTNNVTYHYETPSLNPAGQYFSKYAMGYAQRDDQCGAAPGCPEPFWDGVDYISDPTAEVWVCDVAVGQVLEQRTGQGSSCYYVGYLPVLDRHAGAGGVLFMGSTSEFLGSSLDDSDDIYSGGAQETIKIRNDFYELATRYTSGVTAGSGSIDLDSASPITGNGVSLMGGSLYYFDGDVNVNEALTFSSATIYATGDVYIDGNLGDENSRVGIFTLGNVYIDPAVTDLYVNIFADGYIANQSDSYNKDLPTWVNDSIRVATLWNQLYINGSVSARMVLNQDDVVSELGYNSCDGTEISETLAAECSLETLRQFRLCYEMDASTGGLRTSLERCDEGESLSAYGEAYAATDPSPVDGAYYPSVILDYTAPGNLPIFASEGIFN